MSIFRKASDFLANINAVRLVSFCGLKCTTFLRFKVHHPEASFLFSLRRRFVVHPVIILALNYIVNEKLTL